MSEKATVSKVGTYSAVDFILFFERNDLIKKVMEKSYELTDNKPTMKYKAEMKVQLNYFTGVYRNTNNNKEVVKYFITDEQEKVTQKRENTNKITDYEITYDYNNERIFFTSIYNRQGSYSNYLPREEYNDFLLTHEGIIKTSDLETLNIDINELESILVEDITRKCVLKNMAKTLDRNVTFQRYVDISKFVLDYIYMVKML